MIWPDGQSATLTTDALDRASAINGLPAAGSPVLATFGYDQLSRRTAISRANGTLTQPR